MILSPVEFARVQEAVLVVAKSRGRAERAALVAHLKTLSPAELVAYCDGVLAAAGSSPVRPGLLLAEVIPIGRRQAASLCALCGGPLPSPRTKARIYCGTSCAQKAWRRKHKEAA